MTETDTNAIQAVPQRTLIDRLKDDYLSAMKNIDEVAGAQIQNGEEMKGILTHINNCTKLQEIHDQLSVYYGALYRNVDLLTRNNSSRLMQLGHELVPTLELIKDVDAEADFKEKYVTDQLHKIGMKRSHWYFKERFLLEIEYMIEALKILVEPEFLPLETSANEDGEQVVDRHIPSDVKLSVWRRDMGKCVQCGSKEKLEYDHVIPVSKGGSNTERNIQLLCQTCNRKKSASIQ